jgi:hypothetical protein
MEHAVDLDRCDGCALERGEEDPAERIAESHSEAALQRLGDSMFSLPPTLRAVRRATPYVRPCINSSKPCEPTEDQVQLSPPGIKPFSTNTGHVFAFCSDRFRDGNHTRMKDALYH